MGRDGRGTQRGSAVPLLALGIVVAAGAVLALGRIGAAAADRARAGVAADAAALAGVAGDERSARALAEANGGSLLHFERKGLDTRVTVRVGLATASGRARRTSVPADAGAASGPAPAMRAALGRAAQLLGRPVVVRSVLDRGLVVEVSSSDAESLATTGARAGLCLADGGAARRFRLCAPPPTGSRQTGSR